MKRTELRRKTELARGTKALPKKNAKRAKKRKVEGLVYSTYHKWVNSLPCCLRHKPGHRCIGIVRGHHLRRVGNGGEDEGNEVPACVSAHDEMHWSEDKVEAKYGIDLHALAARLLALWQAMNNQQEAA